MNHLSHSGTVLISLNIRQLFRNAKARAPCIIYFDEFDSIGAKRKGGGYGGKGTTQYVLELDRQDICLFEFTDLLLSLFLFLRYA